MNKRELFAITLMAGLCASAAVPVVSNVATSQDSARRVKVSYTLSDAPGIVTLTAQTNRGDGVWVDVSSDNLTYVAGDVNKVVETGDRSLTWQPHKSWPDQLITGGNIRIGVKAWSKSAPPDYMVVSLVSQKSVAFYPSKGAIPGGVQDDKYKTDYLVMRKIPAAGVTWRMGSPETPKETGRGTTSENSHEVTLKGDYYIGIYPVTQRQYERIMGSNPTKFKDYVADYMTRPVDSISYDTIRGSGAAGSGYCWPGDEHKVLSTSFMGVLRAFTGVNNFDLPTDAQWEFACRAGCGAALYDGTELERNKSGTDNNGTSENLARLARYANNGGKPGGAKPGSDCTAANATARVGTYEPNAWGIYDTLGNVWEWCLDWYLATLTSDVDPEKGPAAGTQRVLRGGSYGESAARCRCATRAVDVSTAKWDSYGFRAVCQAVVE